MHRKWKDNHHAMLGGPIYYYLRARAIAYTEKLVHAGKLPRLKTSGVICADCPDLATMYDHRDYLRPDLVVPVCQTHNARRGPAKVDAWKLVDLLKGVLTVPNARALRLAMERCRHCNHRWIIRTAKPVKCPKCKRLMATSEKA
jgi:ribosomal protein S27E